MSGSIGDVHKEAADRLGSVSQRYTQGRRAIVEVLASSERPLTVPEMLASGKKGRAIPQSSAYRNLAVLVEAAVVRRLAGNDEFARYELAEDLAGHHHHLHCDNCGAVADVDAPEALEQALADAARIAAAESGFQITGHRMDLVGRCADCSTTA
jgi:Fur family transcriptional regulator, ferric uptake regulator